MKTFPSQLKVLLVLFFFACCWTSASANITIELNPNCACFGQCNGSVDATVSGDFPPFSYSWSNGATTEDLTDICPGTYFLTVTDEQGGTEQESVIVCENPALDADVNVPDKFLCYNTCVGEAIAEVSGGTPPYTYNWDNGSSGASIDELCAGLYCVTITDAQGCTSSACGAIVNLPELTATIEPTDPLCAESCDGSIDLTPIGGTPPYSYSWNDGTTTEDRSELCEGEYCVTITDSEGCTYSICTNLESPPALEVIAVPTNTLCFEGCNGSVDATASGGTPPYSYDWSNGATTEDISQLCSGQYCVTVTDANGCTATYCTEVENASQLTVEVEGIDPLCPGSCDGSATANTSGGTEPYSYQWSNGATTESISGLCDGQYCVTVTDANGCTGTGCFVIENPPNIVCNVKIKKPKCYGDCNGSINVTTNFGNPPYTYIWSNGATTQDISGLCAGVYCVTTTDANGCTKIRCMTVKNPLLLQAEVTAIVQDDCNTVLFDGAIDITVSGGKLPYQYLWSNGATTQDISGLSAGTYSVTVTDKNNCTAVIEEAIVTCLQPPPPEITCPPGYSVQCVEDVPACNPNDASATSSCDDVIITCFQGPLIGGACGGTITNTYTATDDCNQSVTCTQVITINDDTAPVIICPDDILITIEDGSTSECIDYGGGGVATVENPDPTGPHSQVGVDFRQPRNEDHPTDPLDWANGINNHTQAEYFEGMGNPQRIIFTELDGGDTHTLLLRHEAVKHQSGDRHAYDFLMSWDQAVETAGNIGNGSLNELLYLNDQTCNDGIAANAFDACSNFTFSATAELPDAMGNPPNHHGIANVDDNIECFEDIYGNRDIEIEANAAISDFSIVFEGYSGSDDGDNYAWYTITWTSSSEEVMIKLAGRAAVGSGTCGYGSCFGAGSISGGPYHFKLDLLDGYSLGNRDNQLMVGQECDVNIPVTFGIPTATDNCDPNPEITLVDSTVTNTIQGDKIHCKTWMATDDCDNNSSECTQCIRVTCEVGERLANVTEEITDGLIYQTYPVPFTSHSTIEFSQSGNGHVVIELFTVAGVRLGTLFDGDVASGQKYFVDVNGTDLLSGVYFYRISSDDASYNGKLLLVK